MSRCGCGPNCSCVVRAGDNVVVTGTGSGDNPYIVSATGGGGCDAPSDLARRESEYSGRSGHYVLGDNGVSAGTHYWYGGTLDLDSEYGAPYDHGTAISYVHVGTPEPYWLINEDGIYTFTTHVYWTRSKLGDGYDIQSGYFTTNNLVEGIYNFAQRWITAAEVTESRLRNPAQTIVDTAFLSAGAHVLTYVQARTPAAVAVAPEIDYVLTKVQQIVKACP